MGGKSFAPPPIPVRYGGLFYFDPFLWPG